MAVLTSGVGGWDGWLGLARNGDAAVNGRRRRVHFVGIGGIGMSGIAEVLLTLGYAVSGSDLADSDTTRRLERLGASIHAGPHDAAHVTADIDVLVISSAVTFANAEVVRARELKIPVIPRAEMLLDRDLDGARLAATLRPLLEDPARRAAMAARSRALGRPDAATRVADECLRLLRN